MIATNSVIISKKRCAIPLMESDLWQPVGKVGIISLCPISGISLMRKLGGVGINAEFLTERNMMHGFISDIVDFDLIFITENDNTSLINSFRLLETAREFSGAHIILVSSRQEAQSLSKVFESVCDVVVSFPIDKEKLSYVVRQLVNSTNPIRPRVLGPKIGVDCHAFNSGLLHSLAFYLVLGAVTIAVCCVASLPI